MKRCIILLFLLFLTGCSRDTGMYYFDNPSIYPENTEREEPIMTAATEAIAETTLPTEPELLTVLIDPKDHDFVRVKDYIPDILTDLKYGTEDNFSGQVIYEFEDVFLRYGTVMKLKAVCEELAEQGLRIKIWDGFRPASAQFKLWEVCPDPTYVANPNKGFSNHSRGYAVDLTLVDAQGRELEMPTGFDDFSAMADRDYSDVSLDAAENARFLEDVMEHHGFQGYWGEWWHFNDSTRYDVEECFDPGLISKMDIMEDAELLEVFGDAESGILRIPAGEHVTLMGYRKEFALVEYWGYRGYIPLSMMQTVK